MLNKDWKLVSKDTGKEAKFGDKLTSFRYETYKLIGGSPPHKPSSTGSIYVVNSAEEDECYYPSVFGLKWEKQDV